MTPASLLLSLHGASTLAATSTSTKSSGSPAFFIFLILLIGVYFLWLRPQRQKLRAQQVSRVAPEIGDEIVTTAGIIGRLVRIEGDRATVEVSPGQFMTIHRTALGRRLDPVIPESPDDDDDLGPDHDGHDHDGHDHDEHDHGEHDGHDHDSDGPPQRRWWPGSSSSSDETPGESN